MKPKWMALSAALVLALSALPVVAQTAVRPRLDPLLQHLAQLQPQQRVRVIVQQLGEGRARARIANLGGQVVQPLPMINAFAAVLPAGRTLDLAALPDVKFVSLDRTMSPTDNSTGDTIQVDQLRTTYPITTRANQVWDDEKPASTGTGVAVAVLDTGVNSAADFGKRIVASIKANPNATTADDTYGHGTHVAGILAGKDPKGHYVGIAPNANIVSVKVSDDQGNLNEADAIAGLQWIYDHAAQYNIKVVNVSATTSTAISYNVDPLDAAMEKLWFAGITVVVAAGNRGGEPCATCYAPANDPYVITVGAVDDHGTRKLTDDTFPTWSSAGTTQDGFSKPDVLAPGTKIVSVLASRSAVLPATHPNNITSDGYFRMGGTSMSTPMVSGAAALMLARKPSLTPDQVKWAIINTARPYKDQPKGAPGIVNVQDAYEKAAGKELKAANAGLTPSAALDLKTGSIRWNNVYWGSDFWNNVYWGNVYWGNVYWGNVYWGNVYWGNVYWGNVYWGGDPNL